MVSRYLENQRYILGYLMKKTWKGGREAEREKKFDKEKKKEKKGGADK